MFYLFYFSFSFNSFCMYIMGEFFILLVLAKLTLYLSSCLVFISCCLIFKGNMCYVFLFFTHFWAKFKHKNSLLFERVSRPSFASLFFYGMSHCLSILFVADFCILSRSFEFSQVRLPVPYSS